MSSYDDNIQLLTGRSVQPWWKKSKFLCPLLCFIGVVCFCLAVGIGVYKQAFHDPIGLKIMALNTWGMPALAYDKEARMQKIGKKIAEKEYDVYLLEELWMRPDHAAIQALIPKDYYMTEVYDLAVADWCDGRVLPSYCSGLAIVSRFPFVEKEFNVFSVHGDLFYGDGEYFARKGVGRVRIEPEPNVTVDLFVTHTAAGDDNAWYRERQTKELVEHVKKSTADFAILGGDFNIDPRMTNETTYETLNSELSSAAQEFFRYLKELLAPQRSTYGNPENTYSNNYGPQLYDYIFHRSKGWNAVAVNLFDVPFLKALINSTLLTESPATDERHQALLKKSRAAMTADSGTTAAALKSGNETAVLKAYTEAMTVDATVLKAAPRLVSLSDHEAVTSHFLLFKYRW